MEENQGFIAYLDCDHPNPDDSYNSEMVSVIGRLPDLSQSAFFPANGLTRNFLDVII